MDEIIESIKSKKEDEYANARAYVKPMTLKKEDDVKKIMDELKKGNFVVLNITDMKKRNTPKLSSIIMKLKKEIKEIDGDLVGLKENQQFILLTPTGIKIIKKK